MSHTRQATLPTPSPSNEADSANGIHIQNIDAMRRRVGIDDDELHEAISLLQVGDLVKLTLVGNNHANQSETVLVRITDISRGNFQGRLAHDPGPNKFHHLAVGATLSFRAGHIHSLHKDLEPHDID